MVVARGRTGRRFEDGDAFSDFFLLALETGARRAALLAMRWADLDLEAGVWVIPSNWSKNRRELAIPLIAEAITVLRRRLKARAESPWVFPSPSSRNGHLSEPRRLGPESALRRTSKTSLSTT